MRYDESRDKVTQKELKKSRGSYNKFSEMTKALWEKVSGNSSQLETISQNIEPTNIKLLSESIFGAGSFSTQLAEALNCQVDASAIYGGAHIGTALAEMAEEIYVPCVTENAIRYSNDINIGAGSWLSAGNATITKTRLPDGLYWTKVVGAIDKYSGVTAYAGITPFPVGATGAIISFDLYIPEDSGILDIRVLLDNRAVGMGELKEYIEGFEDGKKYKINVVYNLSDFPAEWVAGAGDSYWVGIWQNSLHGDAPATYYIRNVSLSWHNESVYEKYIPTTSSPVLASTSAFQKVGKKSQQKYEAMSISYGRNEANAYCGALSHYLAYDKLMELCQRTTGLVVPTNPPPKFDTVSGEWAVDDTYISGGYDYYWNLLMKKWNVGVDVNTIFREKSNPSELMADSWHPSYAGSTLIASEVANQINSRRLVNNTSAELRGKVRYYVSGIVSGTWSKVVVSGIEERILNDFNSYCLESSTANDYLLFENIECQQVHLICREDDAYGTLDIIVDEDTGNEQVYTYDPSLSTDRFHGHFMLDFGESGTHTIKILNKEDKVSRIHGIVVI